MMTSFDLDTFLAQPRLGGLALSPDGRRLVVGVSTPAPDGKRMRTAWWAIDPDGEADPRQLTRSAQGEATACFARDGSLLFASPRPDPDEAGENDGQPMGLWQLPAEGGEARLLFAPAAGVTDLSVAQGSGHLLVSTSLYPGATSPQQDRERDEERRKAGVSAQLFSTYPIRFWDRYLGPREPAWFAIDPALLVAPTAPSPPATPVELDTSNELDDNGHDDDEEVVETDGLGFTPDHEHHHLVARGISLRNQAGELTPDGSTLITGWQPNATRFAVGGPGDVVSELVAIDVETRERRTLASDHRSFGAPSISHDGRFVLCVATDLGEPGRAADSGLVLIDLTDDTRREVAVDLDLWPTDVQWLPTARAAVFEADVDGHHAIFRLDLGEASTDDRVTRLSADGAVTDVVVAPDGEHLYALYATIGSPPRPVRFDTRTPEQTPTKLPSPVGVTPANATVERLQAVADDGQELGAWLVMPTERSGTVPLITFIHGGPLGSWNTWHWRWNPFVFADAGYAVLLPDPALSTGYGRDFIQRGWGRWGERPYTDLMTLVEAAAADRRVDDDRLVVAGGSFGGYMANWVAGQTDRFSCIITHASLWSLQGFHGTTDIGVFWEREFGDPYQDPSAYREHSPDRHIANIRSPMLVIHGEQDLRVPVSESLILWTDLARHGVDARFLYFPDEHHWIVKPQNIRLWYETVLGFVAEHVAQEPFEAPKLLGPPPS